MRKKALVMFVTVMLLIHCIIGAGLVPVSADATSTGSKNILTKVTLKDQAGGVIDAVYNPDAERVVVGAPVTLEYEWELENGHNYVGGSTFEFDIPREFELYNKVEGQLIEERGLEIGTFVASKDGHVVVTFNEDISDYSNIGGTIIFHTNFSKTTITGSTEVKIPFPLRGGQQVAIVHFKPDKGSLLHKSGSAIGDKQINWSIDVNTLLERIDQAAITDETPTGLTLDALSIQVHKLNVNVDGSTRLGDLVTSGFRLDTQSIDGFRIDFDGTIDSAYRVLYTTDVGNGDETSFTNTVNLTGNKSSTASDTVPIQRPDVLTKEVVPNSYNEQTRTVSWIIEYNFRGKHIPKPILEDRFNDTQHLVAGSLEVRDRDTGVLLSEGAGNDYTVSLVPAADGKTGFDLEFNGPINSGYIIKYATKANDRILEDEEVVNTVTTAVYGSKTAAWTHKNLVIQKSRAATNYNTKEASWSIVINKDNYAMKDVIITDAFVNSGQQFKQGSLVIKDEKNNTILSEATDYDFTSTSPDMKQGFSIGFKQPINGAYTVTYVTYFNPDWKDNNDRSRFLNRATITGEEMDGTLVDVTAEDTLWSDSYTRNNGVKVGKYDPITKAITWTIKSNYNKKSLTNAAIVDTLKQGQKYIDGSLEVYEMILTGSENGTDKGNQVDPSKYMLTPPTEANGNELLLTFNTTNDDTPYWIEFKTSLQDNVIIDKGAVENEAVLREGNNTLATWKGNAAIPQGGEFVSKGGEQDDDKINWTIYINRGQSYVENAKIIDEPTPNQVLVEDSFRLYKAKVNSNGVSQDITGLTPLQEGTDFSLVIASDDSGNFELSFNESIYEAYILKYETLIDAGNGEPVGNTVHFEGSGIKTDKMISNKEIIVQTSGGSGTGSGIRGNLEITKVDEDDPSQVLEGAVFVLKDAKGKRPAITEMTDVDGKALFRDLLYGDYVLEETQAPEGYTVLETMITLTLDASIKTDGNVKRIAISNAKEVEPPVNPPVTPPVNPPVTPPVNPPVTPPVNPPVSPPVDPVIQPVDPEPEELVNPKEPMENAEDHDSDANAASDGSNSPSSGEGSQDHDENANASDGRDKTGAAQGANDNSGNLDVGVSKLPKTGESSNLPYYAAGLAMISVGVYLRRKTTKQA